LRPAGDAGDGEPPAGEKLSYGVGQRSHRAPGLVRTV
jgi:hypothetical protein